MCACKPYSHSQQHEAKANVQERDMATCNDKCGKQPNKHHTNTHTHIRILFASVFRFKYHFIISCFYAPVQVAHTLKWLELWMIVGCFAYYYRLHFLFPLSVGGSLYQSVHFLCPSERHFKKKKRNADFLLSIGAKMIVFIVLIIIVLNELSSFLLTIFVHSCQLSTFLAQNAYVVFFLLFVVVFHFNAQQIFVHLFEMDGIFSIQIVYCNVEIFGKLAFKHLENMKVNKEKEQSQTNKHIHITIKCSLKHETNHLFALCSFPLICYKHTHTMAGLEPSTLWFNLNQ